MNSLRVLHVDDEPDIREVVEMSLALDPEFSIMSCGSGSDALAAVDEWNPDLVLLDVMMPVMDGPTTLKHLRERETTANTPIVFMTARAQAREIEAFVSLGAVGVIPKPFDPMTLAASVRKYATPVSVKMDSLRDNFLERTRRDATNLAALRHTLAPKGNTGPALEEIRTLAHSLAGAAGIFGFPATGDKAAALTETIEAMQQGGVTAKAVEQAIDALLAELGHG